MITVISGTNRPNSLTSVAANHYVTFLRKNTEEQVNFLSLESLSNDILHADMYQPTKQAASLAQLQDEFIIPANKFVFVLPEYNGSFPGVLKLFIDACSVRENKKNFKGKKAALIGVADGRAGNLRGLDHLTGMLNYLGVIVMPDRLPISSFSKLIDKETRQITDEPTLLTIENHTKEFSIF